MAESLVTSDVGDVLANFQALWAARVSTTYQLNHDVLTEILDE